jgi:predicted GIY-YIG superfamily endonuclease
MFTVYVLSLLYVDGYYVGFSSNFPKRLKQHIFNQGARITREFGVASIKHTEEVPTVEIAKAREDNLVRWLSFQGALVWGAGRACRKFYTEDQIRRPTRVVDPTAPERAKVTFLGAMP